MAETGRSTACQIEKDSCKRDAQAVCLHCSKSFCRIHFAQHLQVIEIEARAELSVLTDRFNDTIARFDQISAPISVTDKPFADLDRWAAEAHRAIDDMVQEKRQELKLKIQAYTDDLLVKKREQWQMIHQKKTTLDTLIAEGEPTASEKAEIEQSLEEAKKYFKSIQTHRIEINATKPVFFFDIKTETPQQKSVQKRSKRRFEVTYVRLSGTIRKYFLLSMKDGTMEDLIHDFIRKYKFDEQASQIDENFLSEVDNHCPMPDRILPVEIYNFRILKKYKTDEALSSINTQDIIVFYEIPQSSEPAVSAKILLPCQFHRGANSNGFLFPIYLSIPRDECTGHEILMELYSRLPHIFHLNSITDSDLFKPTLYLANSNVNTILSQSLDLCLDQVININKENTLLEVIVDEQISVKTDDQPNSYEIYDPLSFATYIRGGRYNGLSGRAASRSLSRGRGRVGYNYNRFRGTRMSQVNPYQNGGWPDDES